MPPPIGGWVMQVVGLMPHYHLPFLRFWWAKGRGYFGRVLRTFARRGFCLRSGERTPLCFDREGRVGFCALRLCHLDEVPGRALSGAYRGDGTPNPSSGILSEAKSGAEKSDVRAGAKSLML
jgi:hypothetical protein